MRVTTALLAERNLTRRRFGAMLGSDLAGLRYRRDRKLVGPSSAAESSRQEVGQGEMLQKWRNIGQFSALAGTDVRRWARPDEICFTMSQASQMGVLLSPVFESKRKFPVKN